MKIDDGLSIKGVGKWLIDAPPANRHETHSIHELDTTTEAGLIP
jgi:hypothetical protein